MNRSNDTPSESVFRSGLTLIELLIAMSIMAMVAGSLGALAHSVQLSYEYTEGYGKATQHARVILDRIERHVEQATANDQFPGFLVVPSVEGSYEYPETLVIWRPSGDPSDPDGLPTFNELIIYAPNLSAPGQLLEITVPHNSTTVPAVDDLSQWRSALSNIRAGVRSQSYELTSLLRICRAPGGTGNSAYRGAVRFSSQLRPSAEEWSAYRAGTLDWDELSWVQNTFGSTSGLRQALLQIELQLMPGDTPIVADPDSQIPIPFFGSAALIYQLER